MSRGVLLGSLLGVALLAGCSTGAPLPARAPQSVSRGDAFTGAQLSALERGDHVVFPSEFERDGGRYVGGVAYQIVEAPAHVVLAAVRDPELLGQILPRTKSVTELEGRRPQRLVVRQGNDWVQAEYTVALEELPTHDEVRFFLDATQPHDIDDVYGYFHVEPLPGGRTLVGMGVALDVGPGLVRVLFERRIQALMLETPRAMRDVVERASAEQLLARRDTP